MPVLLYMYVYGHCRILGNESAQTSSRQPVLSLRPDSLSSSQPLPQQQQQQQEHLSSMAQHQVFLFFHFSSFVCVCV